MKSFKALFQKYREIIFYLIFGGATTVVSLVTYALFVRGLHMEAMPGEVASWVCAVVFAFVTNKLWVFESKGWKWPLWLREAGEFFAGRVFSGVVEIGGMALLIQVGLDQTLFGVESFAAKIIVTVVVIILNYFISKFIVFRKKDEP